MATAVDQERKETEEPAPKLSLSILEYVRAAQLQNGLRHGNHQRYRQYCARRLRRLRKSLKFTCGRGRHYVGRELTPDKATSVEFLHLPLMNAERAWAYAAELREDAEDARTMQPNHHSLRRLRKAVAESRLLKELCDTVADDRTCLEAEAYASWMEASLLVEQEAWELAMARLGTVETIYSKLSRVSTMAQQAMYASRLKEVVPLIRYCKYNLARHGGSSGATAADLAKLKMTAMGEGMDQLQSKLDAVLSAARQEQASTMDSVHHRGRVLPVGDAKVKLALAEADEARVELEQAPVEDVASRGAVYSKLISTLENAQRAVADAAARASRAATATAAHAEEAAWLEEHVMELKLRHQVDRSLLLLQGDLARHAGQLMTAESAREAAEALAPLPREGARRSSAASTGADDAEAEAGAGAGGAEGSGASSGKGGPVEPAVLMSLCALGIGCVDQLAALRGFTEDKRAGAHASALRALLQAQRAVFAAEVFASERKWSAASKLCETAVALLAPDAIPAVALEEGESTLQTSVVTVTPAWLARALAIWRGAARRAAVATRARALLKTVSTQSAEAAQVAAALESESGSVVPPKAGGGGVLAAPAEFAVTVDAAGNPVAEPLPLQPQMVPAKPVLFDLALDFVAFPRVAGAAKASRAAAPSAGAAGASGAGRGGEGKEGDGQAKGWFSSWFSR